MIRLLIALWLCCAPIGVHAQSLEGADDPRFVAAVETLLEGDAAPAVRALSQLAYEGNIAARLLLSKLEYRLRSNGLVGVADEVSANVFRKAHQGHEFGTSWMLVEAEKGNAFALALGRIHKPDNQMWFDDAELLLSYGERDIVVQWAIVRFLMRPTRRSLEFLEEISRGSDGARDDIWCTLVNFPQRLHEGDDGAIKDWDFAHWADDTLGAARAANLSGYLTATRLYKMSKSFCSVPDWAVFDGSDRFGREMRVLLLPFFEHAGAPITQGDIMLTGDLIVAGARRGGDMVPIVKICQEACSNAMSLCAASAYLNMGGTGFVQTQQTPLEAVISTSRWRNSTLHKNQVLLSMRSAQGSNSSRAIHERIKSAPLDACFLNLVAEGQP